jgi:hypothetical protein
MHLHHESPLEAIHDVLQGLRALIAMGAAIADTDPRHRGAQLGDLLAPLVDKLEGAYVALNTPPDHETLY